MTAWSEMRTPAAFDSTLLARNRKRERAIIATASDTLFPDLLPETKRPAAQVASEFDGQDGLF
jgi:hypothetical protein